MSDILVSLNLINSNIKITTASITGNQDSYTISGINGYIPVAVLVKEQGFATANLWYQNNSNQWCFTLRNWYTNAIIHENVTYNIIIIHIKN